MPIFLTAPKDLQRTPAYEELLRVLSQQRHQGEEVLADRDLFKDNRHWKKSWKELYGRADKLYVLAREDGTVGLGIYKQWKFLSERFPRRSSLRRQRAPKKATRTSGLRGSRLPRERRTWRGSRWLRFTLRLEVL